MVWENHLYRFKRQGFDCGCELSRLPRSKLI
jgi:hypothetical protein